VKSIRAAAISGPNDMLSPTDLAPLLEGKIQEDERAQFRKAFGRMQEWFLENTRREARAGARIIVWPEAGVLIFRLSSLISRVA
jgi:hypothetical protein